MCQLVINRNPDPFVFYNVTIRINGIRESVSNNETVEFELNPGSYQITTSFLFFYRSKPFTLTINEGERIELDLTANVDPSKPFDSLNWSFRFKNLFILKKKAEVPEAAKASGERPPLFSQQEYYLLGLVSLLPVCYCLTTRITSSNLLFLLVIPVLTTLPFYFSGIKKLRIYLMHPESVIITTIFYFLLGLISQLYLLYFISAVLFSILFIYRTLNYKTRTI
jgi:hypothetical protein